MQVETITNCNLVHVSELKDGQLAIIREWDPDYYVGRLVQRYRTNLIAVGLPCVNGWGVVWGGVEPECRIPASKRCMVEVLNSGARVTIKI